jgi:cytochrome c-type biogenesis protein CcmH/NrfG
MRSWRRNRSTGLEAELRANRPEPSDELVRRIESRVRADGRRVGFRVAFAGALVAGVLAALASVGGLGYAATSTSQAVATAKRVMHVHAEARTQKSAARDQYGRVKAKKCRAGTKRVKGVCKRVRKVRGVKFRRPPFTA